MIPIGKNEIYKSKILATAKEIIETKGLKSLTVSDIANRCKISKRTFYNLFSSKENLICRLNEINHDNSIYIANIKDRIVLKAITMFSESGFCETDMNSIAKEAGVNKASIYRYFASKEELFEHCILLEISKRQEFANNVRETFKDPLEVLARYVEYNCDYTNRPDNIWMLLGRGLSCKNKSIEECLNKYIEQRVSWIEDVIEDGKAKGIFKTDVDSTIVAKIFVTFFNNLDMRPVIDIVMLKDNFFEMICNYLSAG